MSNNYNNCSKERPTPVQRRRRYRRMLWIHQAYCAFHHQRPQVWWQVSFRSEGSFIYGTFELSPTKRNPDSLHRAIVVSNLHDPLEQSITRKCAVKIVPHILPILNRDETTYPGWCLWPHPPASVAAPAAEMSGIIPRSGIPTKETVLLGGLWWFLSKHWWRSVADAHVDWNSPPHVDRRS